MPPSPCRRRSGRHQDGVGSNGFRSRCRGSALVVALLLIGCLLLLGSAILTIGASEHQVGVNERNAAHALYLAEAAVERTRRLLPGLAVDEVLANNLVLGDWVNGTAMSSGTYRAVVTNNVLSIGGLPQDEGTAVCGASTCDTDGLVVISGIGSYQGAQRVIRAVVEVPPVLIPPAPLTIVNADINAVFEGESFLVSGFDRNMDGSAGSSSARPSIALVTSETASALQAVLTPGQQVRVIGAGATPNIAVVAKAPTSDALQRLKLQLAPQADRVIVSPTAISEDLRGSDGAGQVTLIKGNPSADSNQGLDTAGDAILEGNGSGSGVLLCTGQLTLRGSYRFEGIVILVGDGSHLTMEGDATIIGSVLVANRTARNLGRAGFALKDRAQLHFSQEALRGAGRLISAPLRVWQEMITN